MQLVPLSPELEHRFWDIVRRDYADYYFFIFDWLLQKQRTQIFLAIEANVIVGLMLIYDGYIVQLRGEAAAIRFLLANLTLQKVDVQVPSGCGNLLLEKYPHFELKENIILMKVKKGQEQSNVTVEPQPLNAADAPAVAELMHVCYPEMWSEISAEQVEVLMAAKEAIWLGIKVDGKLAAFGYAVQTPKVSHVTWIATHPRYQRRGYASSIVSSLVKECLVLSEEAIIYVVEDNIVAKHIYQKAGFTPYKSYVFLKT